MCLHFLIASICLHSVFFLFNALSVILIMKEVKTMYKGERHKLPSYSIPLDDLLEYHGREIEREKEERRKRRRKNEDAYRNEFER